MDAIEFEALPRVGGERGGGIRIRINGTDLVDLLRVHELPFAEAEGAPLIAGNYEGLPPDRLRASPLRLFLGLGTSGPYVDGKHTVQVLECECGEPGCWPLIVRIAADRQTVVWSHFKQPFRDGSNPRTSVWSYSDFGPFVFDRSQYDDALSHLGAAGSG